MLTRKKINELNVDSSTKIYLNKINMLLDTYAPIKKSINKNQNLSLNLG